MFCLLLLFLLLFYFILFFFLGGGGALQLRAVSIHGSCIANIFFMETFFGYSGDGCPLPSSSVIGIRRDFNFLCAMCHSDVSF